MKLLNLFTQGVDFVAETRAPLDTDGAPPSNGSFEKQVSEMLELWVHPAVKLSDLVSFNMH
jgi:linoleate 10R-lipoxygenase